MRTDTGFPAACWSVLCVLGVGGIILHLPTRVFSVYNDLQVMWSVAYSQDARWTGSTCWRPTLCFLRLNRIFSCSIRTASRHISSVATCDDRGVVWSWNSSQCRIMLDPSVACRRFPVYERKNSLLEWFLSVMNGLWLPNMVSASPINLCPRSTSVGTSTVRPFRFWPVSGNELRYLVVVTRSCRRYFHTRRRNYVTKGLAGGLFHVPCLSLGCYHFCYFKHMAISASEWLFETHAT